MSLSRPTLHLVCGKIAAGKSTYVNTLALMPGTIALREDYWLARLYPGEQINLIDYARNSTRLRSAITSHLVDVLQNGLSIALDFPANTPGRRAWMRTLFESAGCEHRLHYFDVADETCKARLRRRNESGEHEFTVSEQDFDLFTRYFVPPIPEESFDVVLHRQ